MYIHVILSYKQTFIKIVFPVRQTFFKYFVTNLLNRRLLRDEMMDWDLRDTKTKLMMGTEECVMTCSPPDIREDKPGVQTAQFVHRTSLPPSSSDVWSSGINTRPPLI